MRSAAESDDVGWPEPAALEQRMLSIRSCRARSRYVSSLVPDFTSLVTDPPYAADLASAKRGSAGLPRERAAGRAGPKAPFGIIVNRVNEGDSGVASAL